MRLHWGRVDDGRTEADLQHRVVIDWLVCVSGDWELRKWEAIRKREAGSDVRDLHFTGRFICTVREKKKN